MTPSPLLLLLTLFFLSVCLQVETIGDAYMVVANLSRKCSDHADQMIVFGLRLQEATTNMIAPDGTPLRIRLGINSGHVVGGVIGSEMPHFCLFGE
jgi:class 3 adenylate cyclase